MKQETIEILKKEWYIQTFTGTPLHLMSAASSGFTMKKFLGYGYTSFLHTFKNDLGEMYYSLEDLNRISKIIQRKIEENPDYLKETKQLYEKLQLDSLALYKKIDLLDLEFSPDTQLYKLINQTMESTRTGVGIGHLIEAYALTVEESIKKELIKYTKEEKEANELFILLTTPVQKSFTNESEEFLIKIANSGDEKLREKMIYDYINKFGWVQNSYAGKKWITKESILEQLQGYKNKKPLEPFTIIEKKNEAVRKYSLPLDLINRLKTIEFLTIWQDERKKYILLGVDYTEKLLLELSTRIKIPLELLRYSIPGEINERLKTIRHILEGRREGSIYIETPETTEVYTESNYEKALDLLKREENTDIKSINGSPASLGYALGRARVMIVPENAKFQQGEILVTAMTRPEFLPIMKKASAIVTDEGGVTSHAAIVARELGIPCVIGTKIATKAIKTGDLIEVKANHGLIIIQERRK
jgi:phosphohistidine swiveling domain-containing protein